MREVLEVSGSTFLIGILGFDMGSEDVRAAGYQGFADKSQNVDALKCVNLLLESGYSCRPFTDILAKGFEFGVLLKVCRKARFPEALQIFRSNGLF